MEQKVIKPFHMFNYHDNYYIINIEEMSAMAIDHRTAGVFKDITAGPLSCPAPHMEEELKKLGLLSEAGKEKAKAKNKQEAFPIVNMCLFLTQSCNLKCVYCYGDGGEYGTGGNMEEKTAFQAVDWLIEQSGKMKKVHLGFFGGEPFLRFPLMKSIVEYTKKRVNEADKKVAFHATTNGTLLDDETIAFIKENNMSVMISFDGTKELQDSQRPYANGEGSYDTAVGGIKKLLQAVPETPGHAVIVGNTDPRVVKDAMKKLGFAAISIMPASRSLFSGISNEEKQERDTNNLFNEMELEVEEWMRLVKDRDKEGLKSFKERSVLYYTIMSLLHNSKKRHACGAGRGLVAVSSSGDVYLCHRFVGKDEYKLGSVFEKELRRDEYQISPITVNEMCSTCFARYYCAGGCKHDNAGSCGTISSPSEDICRLRCREFELAAAIASNLDCEDRKFLIEYDIFPPKPCPFDF